MTQSQNPFLDQFAAAFTSAAGFAEGVKNDAESFFKSQAEAWLAKMDLVKREEFEVVKAMATKAREENEKLESRLAALEAAASKNLTK